MTGASGQAADGLFRKLSWLTLFRLVTVTVLLGGTALTDFGWTGELAEGPGPLYGLIAATYLVSLGFAAVLHARRWLVPLAYGEVALDVAIAAAVVSITGHAESVFVFMFSLGIVNGAILLYRRGALFGAGLSLAGYLPVAVLHAERAPHPLTLFAHGGAFVATAALAGYLAEQLRRTGETLAERETDLAALSALHESIVQSVGSGLLTVDRAGRVTFLNRAGEQLTGLTLAQVRGEPAGRWFAAFAPGVSRGETELASARGERLRVGFTVSPLVARGGEPLGQAVVFQDLTRLRAMEAMVQRSERLADLGRVAAGLAHELRNPLASMSGCVELLRGNAGSEEDRRLMDIVLREAGRLEDLVTRFLQFSRPAPPRRAEVDLAALAAETLDGFARDPAAARVELARALAPALAWCDADQLRQVLWNLLLNAAQALAGRERGRVRVATGVEPDGAVALSVEDDGPGIPREDLAQIFTPFFTTKEQGTGLGLPTVQRIVDAHGGTVAVEPAAGGGTRFTVHLPGRAALERAAG